MAALPSDVTQENTVSVNVMFACILLNPTGAHVPMAPNTTIAFEQSSVVGHRMAWRWLQDHDTILLVIFRARMATSTKSLSLLCQVAGRHWQLCLVHSQGLPQLKEWLSSERSAQSSQRAKGWGFACFYFFLSISSIIFLPLPKKPGFLILISLGELRWTTKSEQTHWAGYTFIMSKGGEMAVKRKQMCLTVLCSKPLLWTRKNSWPGKSRWADLRMEGTMEDAGYEVRNLCTIPISLGSTLSPSGLRTMRRVWLASTLTDIMCTKWRHCFPSGNVRDAYPYLNTWIQE